MTLKRALALVVPCLFGSAHAVDLQTQAQIYQSFRGIIDRPNSVQLTLNPSHGVLRTSTPAGSLALGNMGASQAGTGVRIAGNVAVPLGNTGRTVAAVAGAGVSRAAFLRGAAAALVGPGAAAGIALVSAAPAVMDWLSASGVKLNPNQADYPEKPFLRNEFFEGMAYRATPALPWAPSASAACGSLLAEVKKNQSPTWNGGMSTDGEFCIGSWGSTYRLETKTMTIGEFLPASLSDISPYMDAPEAPALTPQAVVQGVTRAGIDPFGGEAPVVTVSGPSSVAGPKESTTSKTQVAPGTTTEVAPGTPNAEPATKTTTTTETQKVTYQGDRVSYTTVSNTVTNITNNVTNQTTNIDNSETETENDAPEEEHAVDTPLGDIPVLYERKYPDGIVGIWNAKKEAMQGTSLIGFLNAAMPTGFVSGACPSWSLNFDFGGVMNLGSYQLEIPCWIWTAVKAGLIVLALLTARALIFGS